MKFVRVIATLLALSVPAVSLTALAAPPKETKDQHAKSSKKKAPAPSDSKSKDGAKKK
jgi:hypothetical protein